MFLISLFGQVFYIFLIVFVFLSTLVIITLPTVLYSSRRRFKASKSRRKTFDVAFFHPYCNAGGGGERVLWHAIEATIHKYPSVKIHLYTGDTNASPKEILQKVDKRFGIKLPESINFLYLHKRGWIEASKYPHFTLLGQSLGSIVLAFEALDLFVPDVCIDTMGCAFVYPVFSYLAGCKVVSYTHYPTITSEMMHKVVSRSGAHNNRDYIARSPILTAAKLNYYRIFALLYRFAGKFADIIMVNSSWTENHINSLWRRPMITFKVYPPCDTEELQKLPLERPIDDKIKIVSISQFRPEKNHHLQMQTMYKLRQFVSEEMWDKLQLVVVGSTRNQEDDAWVQDLKDFAKHLSIEDNVTFKINVSYEQLKNEFQEGLIGIHTMWNEHFGIGVVECMAAGLIMVAHKSGGPLLDIIEESDTSRNGFLAEDDTEYAQAIAIILLMSENVRNRIREAARSSSNRFSIEEFKINFLRAVEPVFGIQDNDYKT
ncbi:GDP-Man:Man(3)GlcNAc(2)-PP-Dol alpha-1,2-mannosyltransferase [Planococcus citri]|uniref:GDP-Man:Man(3)GlcNAc(2)-PP-Dol alpha-1,2-mannosyltransferase n=1 Tax=Planococcus citri TaxID=170843 RepID=UPI0031F73347